ncbi:unnamed protein product [Prunus armeniaca]
MTHCMNGHGLFYGWCTLAGRLDVGEMRIGVVDDPRLASVSTCAFSAQGTCWMVKGSIWGMGGEVRALKTGLHLSVDLESNQLRATALPIRLCISFIIEGEFISRMALIWRGCASISR